MQRELIKIDLAQLRSGAPVAREIYLKMPRNGKMLRIAWRSDELSPELLRRLHATPSAELYALPLDGDAADATSLPLFSDLEKIKPARDATAAELEPALAAIKPERAEGTDKEMGTLPLSLEEIRPQEKAELASEEERAREDNVIGGDFVQVNAEAAETDLSESIPNKPSTEAESSLSEKQDPKADSESESAFGADDEDLYARERKPAREPGTEEEGLLARRRREGAESSEESDDDNQARPEEESLFSHKRREAEEALVKDPAPADMPPEEEGFLARKRREAEQALAGREAEEKDPSEESPLTRKRREAERALQAADESAETESTTLRKSIAAESLRSFSVADEDAASTTIRQSDEALPLPAVAGKLASAAQSFSDKAGRSHGDEVRLGALLDDAAEELFRFSQGEGGEEARSSLAHKLEACQAEISRQEAGGAEPSAALRVLSQSVARVTTALKNGEAATEQFSLLSGKLTETMEEFQITIGKEERLAATALGRELSSVAEVFTAFANGNTGGDEALFDLRERISACLDDTETRLKAEAEPDEKLVTIKASLTEALKALPYTSRAAKAYRDTPLIASRLAAQLAHSLGYVSPAYLGDLALSTWLFFAEKNGAPIELADPPPLVRSVLESDAEKKMAGTPVGDLATILAFLDSYFDNPDCDRTRKDFSTRTFESTLQKFEQGTNPPDAFTAARWRDTVGKGISIHAESLCSRASAKAAKIARAQAPRDNEL